MTHDGTTAALSYPSFRSYLRFSVTYDACAV